MQNYIFNTLGPLTHKFDRATLHYLEIDRRHCTILKSTGKSQKYRQGTLPFLKIDRCHWGPPSRPLPLPFWKRGACKGDVKATFS